MGRICAHQNTKNYFLDLNGDNHNYIQEETIFLKFSKSFAVTASFFDFRSHLGQNFR